jgi:Protein of unknown function (DUF3037)
VPGRNAFQYAILRVVPSVERGERLNVGVALLCPERRFVGARVALDEARVRALAPGIDVAAVREALEALVAVADGDPAAGPLAGLSPSERFGWLAAPSSTVIQPSAIHTGLCEDPAQTLEHLFVTLVVAP